MTPFASMATPVMVPGALPLIGAELTAKLAANCVVRLRSRLTDCPPGTGILTGEPLARAPSVVVYRVSFLTELVFRLIVRARFISLPNILAGEEIVPEILQGAVVPETLAARVAPLLQATPERALMVKRLAAVRASLGEPGASVKVASMVLRYALPAPAAVGVLPTLAG